MKYSVLVNGDRIIGDWKIILKSFSPVCMKIRFLKWFLEKVIGYSDYLTVSEILHFSRHANVQVSII